MSAAAQLTKGKHMQLLTPFRSALVALAACCFAHGTGAQGYPSKPIRVIVPFASGGANDLVARALQRPLGRVLNGTVVVENMAGASTKIATNEIIKAAPDGHTLLLAGNVALLGYYYSGIYDTRIWDQMTILGQTGQMPWGMLEARADAPFKNWAELVSYAKKNPGKLSAGGPAPGGMMNLIVLETAKSAGIDVTYVPFAGGGPSGIALLGGHVEYRVAQPSEVYPNVRAGKTRGIAVAFPTRMPEMPDVPTFKELGIMFDIPAFGFDLWGPPNLPPAIAGQITRALEQAVKDPEFAEVAKRLVYQPIFTGPEALKESMRSFEKNIGPKLEASFPRK
jgi:tripartite-type tricarboxylate transporter receptor subunit TctC